jgi:capsular exopolysaccharide synthesis family protein
MMEHKNNRYSKNLVTHLEPLSVVSEAYKMARTNIEFSSIDQKLRSIVITSSNQTEGKSTTLANLAIAYAQIGRKVLLVDADMRRPSIHRLFGMPNRRGLTNALLNHDSWDSFINPSSTDGLDVMTSGPLPPNPAELLMSARMSELIDNAKQQYDLIMLDCAPVGVVTDAAILSTKVDATIFVVRSGYVDRNQLKRASSMLQKVNARILGYIMTGISKKSGESYHYYYTSAYTEDNSGKKNKRGRRREPAIDRSVPLQNRTEAVVPKSVTRPIATDPQRKSPYDQQIASPVDRNAERTDSSAHGVRRPIVGNAAAKDGIYSEDD